MIEMKPGKDGLLAPDQLADVVRVLNKGGAVVVPTDTSYGLAARIDKRAGLENVFRIKGRTKNKTVSMVVKSRAQAAQYGLISCKPTALWKAFLPGPMTLVVRAKKRLFPGVLRADQTVAIRFIPHPLLMQVLKKLEVPVTITSANRSGQPDIYSLDAFKKQFKRGKLPDVFLNAGRLKKRRPSTVVRAVKGEPVVVIRRGPISEKQIVSVLNKH